MNPRAPERESESFCLRRASSSQTANAELTIRFFKTYPAAGNHRNCEDHKLRDDRQRRHG